MRSAPPALAVVVSLVALGCSSGPSTAARDKRVCAAYETFWDTDYSGGPPNARLAAAKEKLLDAIAHAHDKKLADAAAAVVDGELSTPALRAGGSSAEYAKDLASVSEEVKRKLAAIEPNDTFVQARCDALGRPINA